MTLSFRSTLVLACAAAAFAADTVTSSPGNVTISYFGFPNCQGSAAGTSQPFETVVRSSSGVCNVVQGGGGTAGSWAANCASTGSSGALFFCSDSSCKANCVSQSFSASQCYAIDAATVAKAPNAAKSFSAVCSPPVVVAPSPSASPSHNATTSSGAAAAAAGALAAAAIGLAAAAAAAIGV